MACPASTPSSQLSRPYLQEIPWSHAELSKSGFPHAAYLHRYMHVFRKIHWWTTYGLQIESQGRQHGICLPIGGS